MYQGRYALPGDREHFDIDNVSGSEDEGEDSVPAQGGTTDLRVGMPAPPAPRGRGAAPATRGRGRGIAPAARSRGVMRTASTQARHGSVVPEGFDDGEDSEVVDRLLRLVPEDINAGLVMTVSSVSVRGTNP